MTDMNFFNKQTAKEMYLRSAGTEEYENIYQCLNSYLSENYTGRINGGIPALSDDIIDSVARYHFACETVSRDLDNSIYNFFEALDTYSEDDRCRALDKAIYGLENGHNIKSMFVLRDEYLNACGAEHFYYSKDESKLKEYFSLLIRDMNISPDLVRAFAKNINERCDVTFTSAALGMSSFELKCLCTAKYCCENSDKGITPEAAAAMVCTSIDFQAVADAVYAGEMSEEEAIRSVETSLMVCRILGVLCMAAGVAAVIASMAIQTEGLGLTWLGVCIYLAGIVLISLKGEFVLEEDIENIARKNVLSTVENTFVTRQNQHIAEGLVRIADAMESGGNVTSANAVYDVSCENIITVSG